MSAFAPHSRTPVDCVSLALSGALFSWSKPVLVSSGVHRGSSCGRNMHKTSILFPRHKISKTQANFFHTLLAFCGMIIIAVALSFDMDYARWLEEHQRLVNDLRSMVNSQLGDAELRVLVDGIMSHYDEIFRLKGVAAKSDVFHMLSGMWKTPAKGWISFVRASQGC